MNSSNVFPVMFFTIYWKLGRETDREEFILLDTSGGGVKSWVQRELARESDGSLSEGTKGTWLQLVRSCALCLLCGSRFQSELKTKRNPEGNPREGIKTRKET